MRADGRLAFTSDRDGISGVYVWDGTPTGGVSLLWAAPPGEIVRALAWWTPAP